ncbi:MAG: type II toxin-antitoxin system RelE/ParE family toxin [Clostridia bacterium]|nr:type II toxin-antitoxin system RelE/ParE family toxin [Clostridia bacterium]
MKYSVKISAQAEEDIKGIYEYISFDLASQTNAFAQIGRLERGILSLSEFSERFALYQKEPWKTRGLRMMPQDNYLVFYIPEKDTATVNVVRVMYAGRDAEKQLDTNH